MTKQEIKAVELQAATALEINSKATMTQEENQALVEINFNMQSKVNKAKLVMSTLDSQDDKDVIEILVVATRKWERQLLVNRTRMATIPTICKF
tara:strand:+ start:264 stop:545 length:282 start_codon:yes stop_codon:yes gene_type:complete